MKIFVISLKRSIGRRENVSKQLSSTSATWSFFDAIDGEANFPKRFDKFQADLHRKVFRSRPLSPGEKGCYASHYLLWEKCIELNENIVILEDDLNITPFFTTVIDGLNELHGTLDYIKIEPSNSKLKNDSFTGKFQIFKMTNNQMPATGYSITPKAAEAFIAHSKKWYEPVDNFIGNGYLHGIQSYLITPSAIFPSDLLPETDQFETTIQFKVRPKTPLYFKPTREIARFIRYIRLTLWNLKS